VTQCQWTLDPFKLGRLPLKNILLPYIEKERDVQTHGTNCETTPPPKSSQILLRSQRPRVTGSPIHATPFRIPPPARQARRHLPPPPMAPRAPSRRRPATVGGASAWESARVLLALAALYAAMSFLAYRFIHMRHVAPLKADAPREAFSEGRVLQHLRRLSVDIPGRQVCLLRPWLCFLLV
jgi:hypothetical protein